MYVGMSLGLVLPRVLCLCVLAKMVQLQPAEKALSILIVLYRGNTLHRYVHLLHEFSPSVHRVKQSTVTSSSQHILDIA